jgi:hypothetical protein
MHHLLCVLLHFVAFYAFSGTNLLTRCHCASSLFSAIFSEKLHRKYSRIGQNKSRSSYFPRYGTESKAETEGARGRPHPPWRGLPPGRVRAGCGPLVHLLTSPFRLYILLDEKTLSTRLIFPENILQAAAVVDARSGGSRSSSQHPAREGNHHQRPSSSPCLPQE